MITLSGIFPRLSGRERSRVSAFGTKQKKKGINFTSTRMSCDNSVIKMINIPKREDTT